MPLLDDLNSSLAGVKVDPRDQALVTLARVMAEEMDNDPKTIAHLGAKYLAALKALRLTPDSRQDVPDAPGSDPTVQAFQEVSAQVSDLRPPAA